MKMIHWSQIFQPPDPRHRVQGISGNKVPGPCYFSLGRPEDEYLERLTDPPTEPEASPASLLHCLPDWGLRCLQRCRQGRAQQLRQRLQELHQQPPAVVHRDQWLIVFFERELTQQCRSLTHINRELARRAA